MKYYGFIEMQITTFILWKQSMELIGLLFAGILIIIARLLGANKDNEHNTDKRTDIERFNDWNRY